MNKINAVLSQLDELLSKLQSTELNKKRVKLLRTKVEQDARISELHAKKDELLADMEKANGAKVGINKRIYPGTWITICGMTVEVKEENENVEYMKRGNGIIMYHIEE